MTHTQFFSSGQHIGSHIESVSWNIQHILWLISFFKQGQVGEILVGFQGTVLCKRNANEIRCFSFFVPAKFDEISPRNFVKALANFCRVKRNFPVISAKFRIHWSEISFCRNFAIAKIRTRKISTGRKFAAAKFPQSEILLAVEESCNENLKLERNLSQKIREQEDFRDFPFISGCPFMKWNLRYFWR